MAIDTIISFFLVISFVCTTAIASTAIINCNIRDYRQTRKVL